MNHSTSDADESRQPDEATPGAVSRKLHDRVAVRLGTDIVTGVIAPGETLPTEVEASEQLGVSRTAYREAVRMLAGKGLLVSRAKTGTRVRPRSSWALLDPDVLSWMFGSKPSFGAVKSLFELRMIVEPAAAAIAAERRSAVQLAAMSEALEEMVLKGLTTLDGQLADARFHAAILESTDNEFLQALTEPITTAIRWTTTLKFTVNKSPRNPMQLHRDLFSAIADGDPDRARKVTERLLLEAREDTEAALV